MWSRARRRACALQRRDAKSCVTPQKLLVNKLFFTLRRPRGALGRYQGPTGAVWAAAGVPRRPTDGSDAFPGGGKGLSAMFENCRFDTVNWKIINMAIRRTVQTVAE